MFSEPMRTWGSWKMLFMHDLSGSSWHGIGGFMMQVLIDAFMIYYSFYPSNTILLFMIHTTLAMISCKAHNSSRLECLQIFLHQVLKVITTPNNIILLHKLKVVKSDQQSESCFLFAELNRIYWPCYFHLLST